MVQTGLDVVGMIPVAGEVADLANAGVSAARGNTAEAALSLAAMVPIGGSAATAAKLAGKYSDEALALVKHADAVVPAISKSVDDAASAIDTPSKGFIGKIYRSASGSPDSLTPRPGHDDVPGGGLSFFDSLDNPGIGSGKYVEVDTNKLQGLQAIRDNVPPGHVTVTTSTHKELQEWAATRNTGQVHPRTREILDAVTGSGKKK